MNRHGADSPRVSARHIVWDWNGTLYADAEAMIESTVEAFRAAGLPPLTAERYRQLHTQPIDAFYERLLGGPVPEQLRERLHAEFASAYARRRPSLGLASEALAALRWVAHCGWTQSLLSLHPHDRLSALVAHFDIAHWFSRIDGQHGSDGGTKVAHLRVHLRRLGIRWQDVLLIGDSVDDARAARQVGAACVLYASGLHDRAVLAAEGVPVVTSLATALETVRLD